MNSKMQSVTETSSKLIANLIDSDIDSLDLDWAPHTSDERKGAESVMLYDAKENGKGPSAALMRYTPGTTVKNHLHRGYELIFVLQGTLINDSGEHKRGTLEICPPMSSHALSSPDGCTFLVVWEQPVTVQ